MNIYEKFQKQFGEPVESPNIVFVYHIPGHEIKEFLEEEDRLWNKQIFEHSLDVSNFNTIIKLQDKKLKQQSKEIAKLEKEIEELSGELNSVDEYIN